MYEQFGAAPGVGANEDLVFVPSHAGTHMDALCHVFADGVIWNGHAAGELHARRRCRTGAGSSTPGPIAGRMRPARRRRPPGRGHAHAGADDHVRRSRGDARRPGRRGPQRRHPAGAHRVAPDSAWPASPSRAPRLGSATTRSSSSATTTSPSSAPTTAAIEAFPFDRQRVPRRAHRAAGQARGDPRRAPVAGRARRPTSATRGSSPWARSRSRARRAAPSTRSSSADAATAAGGARVSGAGRGCARR